MLGVLEDDGWEKGTTSKTRPTLLEPVEGSRI
jgi:hypothetical protein